jgi:hypothetical protein
MWAAMCHPECINRSLHPLPRFGNATGNRVAARQVEARRGHGLQSSALVPCVQHLRRGKREKGFTSKGYLSKVPV